jgi:hypothetical protein
MEIIRIFYLAIILAEYYCLPTLQDLTSTERPAPTIPNNNQQNKPTEQKKTKTIEDDDEDEKPRKKKSIYFSSVLKHCEPNHKIDYYINRFTIIEKDYSCSDKYVYIEYEYYDSYSKYHLKKGYVSNDYMNHGSCIQNEQENFEGICPIVKK